MSNTERKDFLQLVLEKEQKHKIQQYQLKREEKEKCRETVELPEMVEDSDKFTGYGSFQEDKKDSFYQTEYSKYAWHAPGSSSNLNQEKYFPRSQKFSTLLAKSGMYRNYSLNTQMDKSFY